MVVAAAAAAPGLRRAGLNIASFTTLNTAGWASVYRWIPTA